MNPRVDIADLAGRLDLFKRTRSWGGECPACHYRAAFSLKAGKHGRALAYCANGCTPEQLTAELARVLGTDWTPPDRPADADVAASRAGKQAAAGKLFRGSTPLTEADPAGLYLASRGLSAFTSCLALRYRGDAHHQSGGRCPALVAEVLDAAGQPIAVHRTYLTRDGRKASLDPNRMTLGPMWGGAVRLTPDLAAPPALVVGEGIETSASAGLLLGLPAWAALSAGNLGGGLVLPDGVRAVTIAADADAVGLKEADRAARRWGAEGRTVRVLAPQGAGQDFNDVLRASHGADATTGGNDGGNR